MITSKGLKIGTPQVGDIVSVRLKASARPKHQPHGGLVIAVDDQHLNPEHYRMTSLFEVLCVNAGQVAVKKLTGYGTGRTEVWPTHLHDFFEASDMLEALSHLEADHG